MFETQQGEDVVLNSRSVHTSTTAHQAPYLMIIRGSFLHVKPPGCEVDNSLPSSTKVKSNWNSKLTPPYALKACIVTLPLHKVKRENQQNATNLMLLSDFYRNMFQVSLYPSSGE